jgi:phosphatidylserine/phosphatidylglycerophosphate/cardiolipin synthase-like enzyme
VIVDGKRLYLGSANLTGAGLGMKGKSKRNFETGILTKDPRLVSAVAAEVGEIAGGKRCADCAAKPFCQREHQAFREALRVACQQP